MNMKYGICTILAAIVLMSVSMLPAMGSSESKNNIDYTETELQDLYVKYEITENDIKFANGELPNYLDGTILKGEKKVLVTEDGKPLEDMKEGVDYDIVISESEMLDIIERAEMEYISKYGVDPSNPTIDMVDGKAIPTEEVKMLVKNKSIKLDDSLMSSDIEKSVLSVSSNPKAVNGNIYVHVYPAKDSNHAPTESYYTDTIDASERFEGFGITVNRVWHYNYWDASDVSSTYSSSDVLADLKEDCAYIRDSSNDIVLGWVKYLDNNGRAYINGAYGVCATTATGVDWPHDSIVQHEISHNFGASDQNSVSHPTCIMNYAYAYAGTNVWCTSCSNTVDYGIDN